MATTVLHDAIRSDDLDTNHIEPRLMKQARICSMLTPFCTLIGLICAVWSVSPVLFLYAFPIVFNIVPGTLDLAERVLGFRL